MYTQCPECHTAFRVTARVLQQAGGRVRCGGCASAFNALDYLSEELPPVPDDSAHVDQPSEEDTQSKKLLETLDQLTGSENVVIEDTGVEWQVLEEPGDNDDTGQHDISDTGTMRWTIEESDDDAESVPEIVDKVAVPGTAGSEDVMRFDDNTPLPDDFDDIVTTSSHTPLRRQEDRLEIERRHLDDMQIDLALGEPDEWVDLLDEVDEASQRADRDVSLEVEEELAAIHSELTPRPASDAGADTDTGISIDEDEDLGPELIDSQDDSLEGAGDDELDSLIAEEYHEDALAYSSNEDEVAVPGDKIESTGEFEEKIEAARKALSGELSDELDELQDLEDLDEADALDDEELSLEGEQVDDELYDEDDDSIAERILRGELQSAEAATEEAESTDVAEELPKDESEPAKKSRYPDHLFDENSDNVETIIMEGEFVHASLQEQMHDQKKKADSIDEAAFLADTYSISRDKLRGGRRKTDPAGAGTITMIVVLALVLAAQVMHASRESLMTVGAFKQTIAPVYRLLGKPVTPQWDIKGWQFQTTNGSTNETGDLLTIFSTVANRSTQPLPYPLVHVSLTDRWEEIIGSRVLEPKDYLAGDLDPSRPVAAGDRFTAVISIREPSADATGFKLNVCYRVAPGQVRCATEDFKE